VPAVVPVDVQLAGLFEALLAVPGQTVTNVVQLVSAYAAYVPRVLQHERPLGLVDVPIDAALRIFDAAIGPLVFALVHNLPSPLGGGGFESQRLVFRGNYTWRSFANAIEDVNFLFDDVLQGRDPAGFTGLPVAKWGATGGGSWFDEIVSRCVVVV
jgi:hypothetical protein